MKDIKDMTLAELEREQIRIEARQVELNRQMRAIRFKKYPKEVRAIMRRLGWAPEDMNKVIHRDAGRFSETGSYIIGEDE